MPGDFVCPQIIAHRGASHYAPENTQAAIELAAQQGAKWIEVDLHLTQDKNIIIMHDDTVDRCTNGKGKIIKLSYAELAKLDAGSWYSEKYAGQAVLSLENLIILLGKLDINVNLEIKPVVNQSMEIAETTVDIINKCWPENKPWPLISSFSKEVMQNTLQIAPYLPRAMLVEQWNNDWVKVVTELKCVTINADRHIMNKEVLADMHKLGKQVLVYTVNDLDDAVDLINMGIDGLITNRSDAIKQALATNNLLR